jgi:hypothetical protein
MISQHDVNHLIEALRKSVGSKSPENNLNVRSIHIICRNSDLSSYCNLVYAEDDIFELLLDYTGKLYEENADLKFDYVKGEVYNGADSVRRQRYMLR